jgi:tetratricopeptide (TPR) repeat protein
LRIWRRRYEKRTLDKQLVELSLAEDLFFAQEYEKALDLNLRIGDRLYDLFDFESALQFTERAEICAEKTQNKIKLTISLRQKGLILQSLFRFSEALDNYNKSLEIEKEIGDRAGEAQTLHQIGRVYQLTNRFNEALDNYNKSLEIARKIGYENAVKVIEMSIKLLKEKTQ